MSRMGTNETKDRKIREGKGKNIISHEWARKGINKIKEGKDKTLLATNVTN